VHQKSHRLARSDDLGPDCLLIKNYQFCTCSAKTVHGYRESKFGQRPSAMQCNTNAATHPLLWRVIVEKVLVQYAGL